jgi:hypothetical protein
MIFNAFQRDDDDAVFTVVRNVSGGARAIGDSVVWDTSASVDGVRVDVAAAGTLSLFRGVLVEALADSAYGKCQVHGYNSAANVKNSTQTDITPGVVLGLVAATDDFLGYAAAGTDNTSGFAYAAETYASASAGAVAEAATKVLIRAL